MVYDKSNELSYRNRAAPSHRCRVERQLRTPGKIAEAFEQSMMATNLQDQLLRIVNGTVCPFTAVRGIGGISIRLMVFMPPNIPPEFKAAGER